MADNWYLSKIGYLLEIRDDQCKNKKVVFIVQFGILTLILTLINGPWTVFQVGLKN